MQSCKWHNFHDMYENAFRVLHGTQSARDDAPVLLLMDTGILTTIIPHKSFSLSETSFKTEFSTPYTKSKQN